MLFDIWNRAQVRRPKTVAEYKTVAGVFEVFVRQNFKVREVAHVTKAHIVAFRDHLIDDGQSYKTVLKKVGIVKSIFSRAASDDVLKSNPGDRVKVTAPRVAAKPRVAIKSEDQVSKQLGMLSHLGKRIRSDLPYVFGGLIVLFPADMEWHAARLARAARRRWQQCSSPQGLADHVLMARAELGAAWAFKGVRETKLLL